MGETGTKREVAPTTPVALIQSGGTEAADTLPVTGLNVGLQVIFGALFLVAGAAMFRRNSRLA